MIALFFRIVSFISLVIGSDAYRLQDLTANTITRRRLWMKALVAVAAASSISTVNNKADAAAAQDSDEEYPPPTFRRIQTQFIAALGDPRTSKGTDAQNWGLWTVDPGPRGVFLKDSKSLIETGVGPYGWKFDSKDWWLEEHGIIMEKPDFPLPSGIYRVTGGRETTAILSVSPNGDWSLQPYRNDNNDGTSAVVAGPSLYDVTHLPCRSARYTPKNGNKNCSPLQANKGQFPVRPGGVMPGVSGCDKQDYAVIFVTGIASDKGGKSSEL